MEKKPNDYYILDMFNINRLAICLVVWHLYCRIFSCQMVGLGPCPADLDVEKNFNLTEYLGTWYEQYRYFIIYQLGVSCVVANYSNNGEGALGVTNSQFNKWDEVSMSIHGVAKINGAEGEAKFVVVFPGFHVKPSIYWVLGTDYTSYSAVWSCEDIRGFHLRYVWILTREKEPTKEVTDKAMKILKKSNISTKFLMKTDQDECTASSEENR